MIQENSPRVDLGEFSFAGKPLVGEGVGVPLTAVSGEGRRPLDPCDFLKKIE